jgi:cobalt-precorrin 5A hydrolase/precorrin-3B C17-methyltransferase
MEEQSANAEQSPRPIVRLLATTRRQTGDARTLVYHPRRLAVGVGCERGANIGEALELIEATLDAAGLSREAVALVASIDLKADEPAVLAAGEHLSAPVRFFPAGRLEAETPRLHSPSDVVFREVGCHGVAEAAALAAAGPEARLVAPKRRSARVTCAVAEASVLLDPAAIGRARGRLAVVGIGPGSADWLTPEARRLLTTSEIVIGYSSYLDLIAPLIAGKRRIASDLGREEERARDALELAGEGENVALVSSGDAGIYAMASLVFECLDAGDLSDGAGRAEVIVAPGISALQAASARVGAPLGHDFCAVSLSDLLTPWETIEARIRAAAQADFVIAFYNPVSRRRRSGLAVAKAVLLEHRPPDTPVVLARNLGRAGETVRTIPLRDLDVDMVDMLTLVLVGASTTREIRAAGRSFVYTPRGYGVRSRPGDTV